MKRAIFILSADTTLEGLTPEQQAAISSVDSQFTLPMPGTQVVADRKVVDGLVSDNFDPAVMSGLGLDWQLLMLVEWDCKAPTLTVLTPLDMDALYPYLPAVPTYDDEGNVTGSQPAPRAMPHQWSGWPPVEVSA